MMAEDSEEVLEKSGPTEERPEYLQEVTDVKFMNISIKSYDKKTSSSGFTKEEYYAYRIISMWGKSESEKGNIYS